VHRNKGAILKKFGPLFLSVALCVRLQATQLPVTLGSTSTFAVLAGSTVTNSGPTTVNGSLGLSPGTAVSGFPPGAVALPYVMQIANPTAVTAQNDLTTAYNDAATPNRDGGPVIAVSGDLGGRTLAPGLYNSATTLGITGTLTLNGTATSIFVFQIGSALTTAVGSQVVLTGGAQAANVFWQVGSSATINAGSIFVGTILAQASISLGTGAALDGRALARTGAVTLLSNTITQPGPPVTGAPGVLAVVCPNSAAVVGAAYSSLVVATGGTPPYTYSITGALPPGLTLNTSTGAVLGTPTTGGPDTFTAVAADSAAGTATASCSITTTVAPATTPAPSSLILVLIGLAGCAMLYPNRERWLSRFKRS
jgi:hypothetical protein